VRGIKECIMWMIDNPRKRLTNDIGEAVYFNGEGFHSDGKMPIDIYNFKILNCYDWELVPEKVDFMTAINSGKKIYPVEYFERAAPEKVELDESYAQIKKHTGNNTAVMGWLHGIVSEENIEKYINGKWIIKD